MVVLSILVHMTVELIDFVYIGSVSDVISIRREGGIVHSSNFRGPTGQLD